METVLIISQRGATTTLAPLPTGASLELSVTGGFPGPAGQNGQTTVINGDGTVEAYDPGDLTLYFENGLV